MRKVKISKLDLELFHIEHGCESMNEGASVFSDTFLMAKIYSNKHTLHIAYRSISFFIFFKYAMPERLNWKICRRGRPRRKQCSAAKFPIFLGISMCSTISCSQLYKYDFDCTVKHGGFYDVTRHFRSGSVALLKQKICRTQKLTSTQGR